jgi:CxxC motif-containing protein (DUF1111 family)
VQSLGSVVDAKALPVSDQFVTAGCDKCHVPQMPGQAGGEVKIYSDLLLHDMGAGLASAGAEGDASAREWRTTPLIGFRGHIPGHRYLHDGRAANVDEAIRWHGGEATLARCLPRNESGRPAVIDGFCAGAAERNAVAAAA